MAAPQDVAAMQAQITSLSTVVSNLRRAQVVTPPTTTTTGVTAAQLAKVQASVTGIHVPGWTEIAAVNILSAGTAVAGWQTLSLSGYIPSTATRVMLTGYVSFARPDNSDNFLQFRRDSTGQTRYAAYSRSVSGTYTVESAFQIEVPISASKTVDYNIVPNTTGSYTTLQVYLIEWYG